MEPQRHFTTTTPNNLPASEFGFAQTQFKAFLTGTDNLMTPCESCQTVILHSIDAPCPFAGLHTQTTFLGVNCEDWKLGFGEGTCKKK